MEEQIVIVTDNENNNENIIVLKVDNFDTYGRFKECLDEARKAYRRCQNNELCNLCENCGATLASIIDGKLDEYGYVSWPYDVKHEFKKIAI